MWIFDVDTKVMPELSLAELRVACLDELPKPARPPGAVVAFDWEDETTAVVLAVEEDEIFVEDDDAYVSISMAR